MSSPNVARTPSNLTFVIRHLCFTFVPSSTASRFLSIQASSLSFNWDLQNPFENFANFDCMWMFCPRSQAIARTSLNAPSLNLKFKMTRCHTSPLKRTHTFTRTHPHTHSHYKSTLSIPPVSSTFGYQRLKTFPLIPCYPQLDKNWDSCIFALRVAIWWSIWL